MNKSKFITTLIIAVLVLLNILNVPYKVEAALIEGVNLYENEGFEKNDSMSPFKRTVSDAFTTCAIQNNIGVDGSKGLRLLSVLNHSCCIENYFDVEAGKSYRVWLTAKNGSESTNRRLIMGVRNYPDYAKDKNTNEWQQVSFTEQEYATESIDFTVGDKDTKAKIYILVGQTIKGERGSAYVDDFVLEETASRPTIDEILDPLTATEITGTAKPGAKVIVTLPNTNTIETTAAGNGTYSVSIAEGSLSYAQTVSAVQYGLYGVESSAATATTRSRAQRYLGKNLYINDKFEKSTSILQFEPTASDAFTTLSIQDKIGVDSSKGLEMYSISGHACCIEYYYATTSFHTYRLQLTARLGKDRKNTNLLTMGARFYKVAPESEGDRITAPFTSETYEHKWLDFEVGDLEGRESEQAKKTKVYILCGETKSGYRGHAFLDNFIFEKTAYPPTISEITNARYETSITGTSEPEHDVTIKVTRGIEKEIILEETVLTNEYSGIYSLSIDPGTLEPGDTITAIQHGLPDLKTGEPIMSHPTEIIAKDEVPPDPPEVTVIKDTDTLIKGTAEAGSTVTITFALGEPLQIKAGSDSSFSIDLEGRSLTAGEIVSITATDDSNNTSQVTKKTVIETSKTAINEDDNIGIYAENFAVKLSELGGLDDDDIIRESNAKVFKLSDETLLASNISINKSNIKDDIGVYPVTLSVQDTNHIIYIFVVNESFTLGEMKDVIITSENFSVALSAVPNLTDNDILLHSKAKAWKLSTGEEITEFTVEQSSLQGAATTGNYNISLTANGLSHPVIVTVTATDINPPRIISIKIIGPEGYTNSANSWTNKDVTLEITAIDDVGIDHFSYKILYDDDTYTTWKSLGFSEVIDNKTNLTINKNGRNQTIFIKASDEAGNENEPASIITQINIDKEYPYSNYKDNTYYDFVDAGLITLHDELSGVYSATLNGTDILTDQTLPNRGENTLIITDKAGNTSTIVFTVLLYTEVKITGDMLKNTEKIETIERGTGGNSLPITPETSVILKNLTNDKEYIGILAYDDTLIFKEIDYGNYEVHLINPSDILSTKIDIPNFELSGSNKSEEIVLESKHVTLNGFGNILENNTL